MRLKKLKKGSRRVQAADRLKLMIQELVAENIDLNKAGVTCAEPLLKGPPPKKTGGQLLDEA
jgi:hypothetical protein